MIVGTAGHIDHGKTTLVRALTGVDTDRLPEEKTRGISIELGYAFMDVPRVGGGGVPVDASGQSLLATSGAVASSVAASAHERLGFIDVPGHERLVHTMLAGATGIDFGLLLVAADDGVMPQTREHLAVLSLLGLAKGAVAITKIDRVEPDRVDTVRDEVSALIADSSLAGSPIVAVSARTGEGVDELRELLFAASRAMPERHADGAFRLAIDRAFTLGGVGTVVTGTVHAGSVKIGDELVLAPTASDAKARVRSLHAQNTSVDVAYAGQRCAVALVGIGKDEISRGQWLVGPEVALSTDRLDARITLWHGEAKALRSGMAVHVHIGASDTLGTVAVLASVGASDTTIADSTPPGSTAFVQLVLRTPIAAWHRDRVVLRDSSSSRTIAGGVVLDPFAPARYRRTPQRLLELAAWSLDSSTDRLEALIDAAPFGISLKRWTTAEGLSTDAGPSLEPGVLRVADNALGDQVLGQHQTEAISQAALTALRDFHAKEPDSLGPDASRLRRLTAPRLPELLWRGVLAQLHADHRIEIRGAFVHLPEHGVRLSAIDQRLAQKIAPLLDAAGPEGSWARDLARDAKESEPLMRTTLARLAQAGTVHQVVKDLYYSAAAVERLAKLVRQLAGAGGDVGSGDVTAGSFRDAANLGRKRAIQLLEYFDRVGLLRRVGDVHRLRADTSLFK